MKPALCCYCYLLNIAAELYCTCGLLSLILLLLKDKLSVAQIPKNLRVGGNCLGQQQQERGRQFSRLVTSKGLPQTSRCATFSLRLSVCVSLEQSQPSIEICNKIQLTINLQKAHYLIAHQGTRALPGR